MGRLFKPLSAQSHNTLIAGIMRALLDGQTQMAMTKQVGGRGIGCRRHCRLVIAGIGADIFGQVIIDHQQFDRPCGTGLQLELTVNFQSCTQQSRQGHRLTQQACNRLGIGMAVKNRIEHRPDSHHTAPHIKSLDREGKNLILARHAHRDSTHAKAPRHQARIPFWACRRFSASSNTTDCGPSITSSVTSSPRWAGRQCMNSALGEAARIRRLLT